MSTSTTECRRASSRLACSRSMGRKNEEYGPGLAAKLPQPVTPRRLYRLNAYPALTLESLEEKLSLKRAADLAAAQAVRHTGFPRRGTAQDLERDGPRSERANPYLIQCRRRRRPRGPTLHALRCRAARGETTSAASRPKISKAGLSLLRSAGFHPRCWQTSLSHFPLREGALRLMVCPIMVSPASIRMIYRMHSCTQNASVSVSSNSIRRNHHVHHPKQHD
jgi:hypothetical protein